MGRRRSDTRERMIASAAALLQEKGASGTSLDDVLAHSGAPRGSVYHHFPRGRAQLLEEALDQAARGGAEFIRHASDAPPQQAFDTFVALWRDGLAGSGFRAGCPVLAVAVEANDDAPQLSEAAARAFTAWRTALADLLRSHGVSPARARRLANLVVASVEGAVVLCRVERSLQPLDDVARELRPLLAQVAST